MQDKKLEPKAFIKWFSISALFCILFIMIVKYDRCKIRIVQIDENKLCGTEGFQFNISQPQMDEYDEWITFEDCWIFKENEDILTFDSELILCDENGVGYVLIGEYRQRGDLAKALNVENDIERSGFICKIPRKMLDLSKGNYRVIVKYNNNSNNLLIDTGYVLTERGLENEED